MNKQHNNENEIVLSYDYQAPKEMVFNAFTTAEALEAWWGPIQTTTTACAMDFRNGGFFHYKMEAGGGVVYGRFEFVTIQPHDLLEFTNAFADEHANIVKDPFGLNLPLEIFYSLSFTEKNGITTITLTGRPHHATPEQTQAFNSIREGMDEGFGATFGKLTKYLAER